MYSIAGSFSQQGTRSPSRTSRWSTYTLQPYREASTSWQEDFGPVCSRIEELSDIVLKPKEQEIPAEQRVIYIFEQLEPIAQALSDKEAVMNPRASPSKRERTATSALLGSVNKKVTRRHVTRAEVLELISERAERIIRDANVFITPAILKSYVELQTTLQRPASFPDVFALYAQKPIPRSGKSGIELTPPNPNKVNAAVDSATANTALSMALHCHDMPLAIDIINTTFCAPAFRRAKILRQAMIPISGLGIAPFAAYALASQFSYLQPNMDATYTTGVAFAGIMTYVAAVSTMGYVAVTTANDQMDRVTWAQGVPLWERWVREEERAAIDRVAGQWGFENAEKRGDEEGEEWEMLREFVGLRGMVLDKVELMEGMQ